MTRLRQLPPGWYPVDATEIRQFCERCAEESGGPPDFIAAVVPHAGWYFSGELAGRTIARLHRHSTVVVIGGHLRPGDRIHVAMEDAVQTPLGDLHINRELRSELMQHLPTVEDVAPDNTVEVQLPLVAALLGSPDILHLRCPPSGEAERLGTFLAGARERYPVVVLGSTDLTHYGPSYGFTDHGTAGEAVAWVRDTNDRRVIEAISAMDPANIVGTALRDRSACSAGAAAAAAAFARASGASRSVVVGSHLSQDIRPSSSFVGYAGIGFIGRV